MTYRISTKDVPTDAFDNANKEISKHALHQHKLTRITRAQLIDYWSTLFNITVEINPIDYQHHHLIFKNSQHYTLWLLKFC
jgi:hypothetical protein